MSVKTCVYVVDDDDAVRDGLGMVLEMADISFLAFKSAEHFLDVYCPGTPGCLLLDINMPGLSGLELQEVLSRRAIQLPIIFLTAFGDIPMTVKAMKGGAVDFLTKPVPSEQLIGRIQAVLQHEVEKHNQVASQQALCQCLKELTDRELEVLPLIVAGKSNKEIARELNISFRTMEVHRARILRKTGVTTILELGHLYETYLHLNQSNLNIG